MAASTQKIALVTGSNRGIGLELVRQLAKGGVSVFMSSRDEAKGLSAQTKLAQEGLNVDLLRLDVTNPESIRKAVETIRERAGKLDILVNNAGILPDEDSDVAGLNVAPETVRQVFETNTLGPLQVSQAMIPLLKKSPTGRIINISSGLGALNDMDGGYAAYRISKAALNAVTRILASELAGSGITVNSVCPGWVKTDMGGPNADRSVEQSAAGILPLLLSDQKEPNGQFLRDGKPIAW